MERRIITVFLFVFLFAALPRICPAQEDIEFEEFTGPGIDHPVFSPDGNKILFASDIANAGKSLWLVNPDGTNMEQIIIPSLENADFWYPVWSPDGAKIAFIYNWDIWIINRDGSNPAQLTNDGALDDRKDFLSFSPDGTKITFCDGDGDISIMNVDGTNRKKLVNGNCPTWSPDSSQIVYIKQFNSPEEQPFFNIWKINADATEEQQLTSGDYCDGEPAWSPDGVYIAFSSDRSGESREIWTIFSNGDGLSQLTHNGDGWSPSWSPDSSKVIFGAENIAKIDLDTGEESQITDFQTYCLPFQQFSLKHWHIYWSQDKGKAKFTISGKLTLPDGYDRSNLKKKAEINIGVYTEDEDLLIQKTLVDFKEHGPIWSYRGKPKPQPDDNGLIIDKMLIFWERENRNSSEKECAANDRWFFIKGRLNISESEQENLLPQAKLTLNIPIQNISAAGALQSAQVVEFKDHKNLWSYNACFH